MHRGYLPIWRKFFDEHPFWTKKRVFSEAEAWIDILRETHFDDKPKQRLINGLVIIQNYGEAIMSTRYCGDRWGWTQSRVQRFLALLKKLEQIDIKPTQKATHGPSRIIIINYECYDIRKQNNESQTDSAPTQPRLSPDSAPTQTKELNNGNNGNPVRIIPPISPIDEKIPFHEIVGYLNAKINSNFKATSEATKKHIRARWNDGYRLEDFKIVIDKKVMDWLDDPKYSKFLRPETLFGAKFDGYLNAPHGRRLNEKEQFELTNARACQEFIDEIGNRHN